MKKIIIIALVLIALPLGMKFKAQTLKPPVSITMGQDLKTDKLVVIVGYDFTVSKVVSADSTVTGQLVMGPSIIYSEADGLESEGYGFFAKYDFPLAWKFRTELGAALYTLPSQGDNPEWALVGAALTFAPNSAISLKIGSDYMRKSIGGSGILIYGNLSFNIAK